MTSHLMIYLRDLLASVETDEELGSTIDVSLGSLDVALLWFIVEALVKRLYGQDITDNHALHHSPIFLLCTNLGGHHY